MTNLAASALTPAHSPGVDPDRRCKRRNARALLVDDVDPNTGCDVHCRQKEGAPPRPVAGRQATDWGADTATKTTTNETVRLALELLQYTFDPPG